MFENDRIEIESRYAFLRGLENSKNKNISIINLPKVIRSNGSITTRTLTDSNQLEEESKVMKEENFGRKKHYPRSIQEYSYFDWSKVKLFENKYKEDEIRASTAMQLQLQQLRKTDEEEKDEFEIPQDVFKSESNHQMNQIITVRFQ